MSRSICTETFDNLEQATSSQMLCVWYIIGCWIEISSTTFILNSSILCSWIISISSWCSVSSSCGSSAAATLFAARREKKTCNLLRRQTAGGTKLKGPIRVSGLPHRLRNVRGICFVPSPFADLEYFCKVLFLALAQSGSLNTGGFQRPDHWQRWTGIECLACLNIFYRIFNNGSTLF